MKNLRVTVNGKAYDVKVEEIEVGAEFEKKVEKQETVQEPKNVAEKPQPKEESSKNIQGSEIVNSPMPGTIVSVNVKAGQSVAKGDVLLVLEAMKMENEIMSPRDAVVAGVNVNKGDSVDSGTPLVSLK